MTYVQREELHIERQLARAIAAPYHIVSLSGPTKTGKTVLCRKVLGEREYIWIDGGEIKSADDFWDRVRSELNIASETQTQDGTELSIVAGLSTVVATANGSRIRKRSTTQTFKGSPLGLVLDTLISDKIILVIDDFHYIEKTERMSVIRNVKGSVFNGLKVILLSVTHRAFDAIKAEPELTGRFTSILLPTWSVNDLKEIPIKGFAALKVKCRDDFIEKLSREAQESPFLMQKFCWEVCFDCNIERSKVIGHHEVPASYDFDDLFSRLATDAGLPIYQRLVAGPQSRKIRYKRPMYSGEEADIYEATLHSIAATGPKSSISYDELRATMSRLLLPDMMPQKHEITSALKHLSVISKKSGATDAIDWDEDKREISVADPYLRFYLRWQVGKRLTDDVKPAE